MMLRKCLYLIFSFKPKCASHLTNAAIAGMPVEYELPSFMWTDDKLRSKWSKDASAIKAAHYPNVASGICAEKEPEYHLISFLISLHVSTI